MKSHSNPQQPHHYHHRIIKFCLYENTQTKTKDGNKVFPKKLDIDELNLFVYKVYKELYIFSSYSYTQSGLYIA